MTAAPFRVIPDELIAWAEKAERRFTGLAITAAPVLGLLPSAIITAVHCDLYLHFGPVWSPLVGAGVEAVSIAIVATRVLLAGRNLAHREKELDRAFVGYLAVIATVNLGLNVAHGFTDGWTPLMFGVTLAELALGALPVPVAWLVATRNEIATIERDALIAQDKDAADKERADMERGRLAMVELSNALSIKQAEENAVTERLRITVAADEKRRAEEAEERREKRAMKTTAPVAAPKPAEIEPKETVVYRSTDKKAAALIPAFIADKKRIPTLAEVTDMIGVKGSQASHYRTKYGTGAEAGTK